MIAIASGTVTSIMRVVWSAVLVSVVVSGLFSLAVVSLIRASELRRTSRHAPAATVYTAVALVALAICLAAVVYGLVLVGQKR